MFAIGFVGFIFGRAPTTATLGEPFRLRAGQRVRIGSFWISLESKGSDAPRLLVEGGFDPLHILLSDLPALLEGFDEIYELRLVSNGPPVTLKMATWIGLRITAPTTPVAWPAPAPRDQPGWTHPTVKITGVWSLDRTVLRTLDRPLPDVRDGLMLVIRYPGGESNSITLLNLGRAGFTAQTGVHPVYAESPGPRVGESPSDLRGRFTADLGPTLRRPTTDEELVVRAAFASYESNEARLLIKP